MKNHALRAATMLAVILMTAFASAVASASAVSNRNVIANIPFDFTVRDKTLPAGEYIVSKVTTNSDDGLLIRSRDGRHSAMVNTKSVLAGERQNEARLVFNRYGDRYFLSQIWKSGEATGRELKKSKSERAIGSELAKTETKSETVVLVASMK